MKRIKETIENSRLIVWILIGTFLPQLAVSNDSERPFYYSCGKKQELRIVDNKILVRKKDNGHKTDYEVLAKNCLGDILILAQDYEFCKIELKQGEFQKQGMQRLLSHENVESVNAVYALKNGFELSFINEVVVKFRDNIDPSTKETMLKTFNLKHIKDVAPLFEIYTLQGGENVIAIANQLYETGLCKFAYPRNICKSTAFAIYPNDPYFQYQVALHNSGQVFTDGHTGTPGADIKAPEAWEITTGNDNIVVAVIDRGVTSDHPDLPNTRQVRLPGSNFDYGDPDDPSPFSYEAHGNACAGIIAATMNNNEGISGIAPDCKIMPIKTRVSIISTPELDAEAIRFAVNHGAKVISNSWGYDWPYTNDGIVSAIQYAIDQGVVVIFAASNSAAHSLGENGIVAFPANANIDGLISVGASDRYDYQADYSPTSPLIDIVAPSHRAYPAPYSAYPDETFEMWTLDIPGTGGCNPWTHDLYDLSSIPVDGEELPNSGTEYLAYTGRFGGTSFACPVVVGVAALMLSVNPNLTPFEVRDILLQTADKIGGYNYVDGRCNEVGYGRVNAYRAVGQLSGAYYYLAHETYENQGDDINFCKVDIEDVVVTGQAQLLIESGRVHIRPPFHATPSGSGYLWIQTEPCSTASYAPSSSPFRSSASKGVTVTTETVEQKIDAVFLSQNTPNPAKGQTLIQYSSPEVFQRAEILITTLMGIPLKRIPIYKSGIGEVAWDVSGLSSGLYFYSLCVDDKIVITKRMLVAK